MISAFCVHAKPEPGLRLSFTREDDNHPENPSRFLFYARSLFLLVERASWKGAKGCFTRKTAALHPASPSAKCPDVRPRRRHMLRLGPF